MRHVRTGAVTGALTATALLLAACGADDEVGGETQDADTEEQTVEDDAEERDDSADDDTHDDGGESDELDDDSSSELDAEEDESDDESNDENGAPGSREDPLEIGESGEVGDDWTVTVLEVDPDADDTVQEANEFNEPPEEGMYVLVEIEATYEGDESGNAGFDLDPRLTGTDARAYPTYDCMASLDDGLVEEPDVEAGGTASGYVCFDMPEDAFDGSELSIEDALDFDGEPTWWQTD